MAKQASFGPWVKGIVNRFTPEQIPDDALVDAVNCNIDAAGTITPRQAWSLVGEANAHSLYNLNGVHYAVLDGVLCVLKSDGFDQIQAVEGNLAWTTLNGEPVYADYTGVYVVRGSAATRLPSIVTADDDEFMLTELPGGSHLHYWRGRLIVGRGNSLIFSEPLRYGVTDTVRGFIQFEERVQWIAPLDTGIYVGLRNSVRFLAGTSPLDMQQNVVGGKTWMNAAVVTSTERMNPDLVQGSDMCAVWMSPTGFALGLKSGRVVYPQAESLTNFPMQSGKILLVGDRVTVLSN